MKRYNVEYLIKRNKQERGCLISVLANNAKEAREKAEAIHYAESNAHMFHITVRLSKEVERV